MDAGLTLETRGTRERRDCWSKRCLPGDRLLSLDEALFSRWEKPIEGASPELVDVRGEGRFVPLVAVGCAGELLSI